MANVTKSMADTAGFIPEIWANVALEVLRSRINLAAVVAKDTDVGAFQVGDILHVPYPGTFTANDKSADSSVTIQTPSGGTEVQVALNKHKEVSFIVEDAARAQASQDLLMRYVQAAIPALAEAIESDLFAAAAAGTNIIGTAGTDLSASSVRDVRKQLNLQKAPQSPRYFVVSAKDEVALMGDSDLQSFFAFAQSQTVEQGRSPVLYGLETRFSQLVPVGALVTLGSQASGNFTLTYGSQTTSNIAYNAAASAVQTALEALSSIGSGNVSVSGNAGGPYTIRMIGAKGGAIASFTANFSGLATPANASIKDAYYNLAFVPDALILAMRGLPTPPPETGVRGTVIRDPESGLVLRVLYSYNPSYLGTQVTLDVLYGTKLLRDAKQAIVRS
ncbi:MAG TPA: P22 phage major capsid protein family protein [Anaerolineaceae bacterium]